MFKILLFTVLIGFSVGQAFGIEDFVISTDKSLYFFDDSIKIRGHAFPYVSGSDVDIWISDFNEKVILKLEDDIDDAEVNGESVDLRAERSGNGDGRVYEISFTADDGNGAMCTGTIQVGVPHDKKDTPVDSGQNYDSTS